MSREVWEDESPIPGGKERVVWTRHGDGPKMKVGRIASREGYATVAYSDARPCDGPVEATFPNTPGGMEDARSWLWERLKKSSIAWV